MAARRYDNGLRRGRRVRFEVDGQTMVAFAGESVAAALLAAGVLSFRRTVKRGEPRGVFCGMGLCFDCAVSIDGRPNVRACMTPVREGMKVELRRVHAPI